MPELAKDAPLASTQATRSKVPAAPVGWAILAWLGPGFLWMVSAAGSGELLFTPRVGALYGYELLWAMLVAVSLKWFINREIGRFTVCTGSTFLSGISRLPRGGSLALALILGPQVLVAISTIAGLAGSAATALALVFPGDIRIWVTGALLASTALVVLGRYRAVEKVAITIALGLAIAAIAAAVSVLPSLADLGSGLDPDRPADLDYGELLPWLGFMLSGAAGMIWYSYWIKAKGYGAASTEDGAGEVDPNELDADERRRLSSWLRVMTVDNSVAVLGTLVIAGAFLILGTELLRPEGLVPEENQVAEVLGELLGGVWGEAGYWFMILAVFVGFWDTVLSDQDGFGRMFADGTRRVANLNERTQSFVGSISEERLRQAFVIVLLTVLPLALYFAIGEPVALLKMAGAIEAVHIPVVATIILVLNRTMLPPDLRPSLFSLVGTVLAAVFFAAFAVFYLLSL